MANSATAHSNSPKIHLTKEELGQIQDPSSTGPLGNPGNHGNQGYKNAIQLAELQKRYKASELVDKYGTISGAIRFLSAEGFETGAIAKFLDKRYQHVRNVLNQPVASNANNNTNKTDA